MGGSLRYRPARLAPRMLRYGHEATWRNARHSLRWCRQHLPSPRERDCPERSGDVEAFFAFLASWRASPDREREDGEVQGELFHAAGSPGKGIQRSGDPLSAALRPVPETVEFHVRRTRA